MVIWTSFITFMQYASSFLFVLSLVIFVHEYGHFWVGRRCGVKAEVFSMGFGPQIWARQDKKGTLWRIALFPLGGYVRFYGDEDAISAPRSDHGASLPESERPLTFFAQPLWKRALIVAAGPFANFLLAIGLLAGLTYIEGRAIFEPRIAQVEMGSPAEKAGFEPQDILLSIEGQPILSFQDAQKITSQSANIPLVFEVERNGKIVTLQATPIARVYKTPLGTFEGGVLGIASTGKLLRMEHFSWLESLSLGVQKTWGLTRDTLLFIRHLILERTQVSQLSGPIGIVRATGYMAQIGFLALLHLVAVLSVSIGLLNLFPIPMLDGGHLALYALEAVRGRPLGPKTQEVLFRFGFSLVIGLMIFTTFNDVMSLLK